MGGKLDATNVIDSSLCQRYMQNRSLTTRNISATLSKKLLKKNAVLCVTAAQPFSYPNNDVRDIIEEYAKSKNVYLHSPAPHYRLKTVLFIKAKNTLFH